MLFIKFARKYFEESEKDLERAVKAFNINYHPQAIFHAQQSIVKGVKVMLEAKRKVIYNHEPELVGVFSGTFSNE